MTKKAILALLLFLPLAAMAQNSWEQTEQKAANPDAKYLAGAVKEVNGEVQFNTTIEAPGKSASEIYGRLNDFMTALTKSEEQTEQSRMAMGDENEHVAVGKYQEWLVFKRKPLVLDQTKFLYQIIARCADGKADVTINRISYIYEEDRDGGGSTYRAEEWITDKYGLNKKQTKLSRVSGKFRKKTIDRVEYLFKKMGEAINK